MNSRYEKKELRFWIAIFFYPNDKNRIPFRTLSIWQNILGTTSQFAFEQFDTLNGLFFVRSLKTCLAYCNNNFLQVFIAFVRRWNLYWKQGCQFGSILGAKLKFLCSKNVYLAPKIDPIWQPWLKWSLIYDMFSHRHISIMGEHWCLNYSLSNYLPVELKYKW